MLYLLMNPLGWLAFTILFIIASVLYISIHSQIQQLRREMAALQAELKQYKDSIDAASNAHSLSLIHI